MAEAKPRTLDPCSVCGAAAIGFNFGVLTCMACKAFFRRNAVKLGKYEFVCAKDGDCPITHIDRRLCNCCRLAKCFRVGMQRSMILTDGEKEARRQIVAQNRQRRINKTLATSSTLPPSVKTPNASICLTTDDHQLLSNIFNTYESICLDGKQRAVSRTVHSSVYQFFQDYLDAHQSLFKFIMRVPQINSLISEKQLSLSKNQLSMMNHINVTMLQPAMSNNLLFSLQTLFGASLASRMFQCVERVQQLSYDPILLKLLLLIIALSTGTHRPNFTANSESMNQGETLALLRVQNLFVELLWKYLLSRSSTEMHAVKLCSKLVQSMIFIQTVHQGVEECVDNQPTEIQRIEPLIEHLWVSADE